ncbi:MAG: CDP-archaeol synthase [Myxococcales bacterium]|nr:CDP-archaeol synthase [Myxococcales bacterium]
MTAAVSETGSDGPIHPRPATPLAPRPEKKGSDLRARLLTAAVLVPAAIYVIIVGGLPYLAFITLFILLGMREFYRLIEEKGAQPLVSWGLAAGAALPVVAYIGNEYHVTLILTATLLGVMIRQLGKAQIGEALVSISGTFFGVFYVGWLLSHAIVLRNFYGAAASRYGDAEIVVLGIDPDSGIFFISFCMVAVVMSDTGAYFAGRAWGRRKLAPRISPGKTVEGAVGGVIGGTLGGLATKSLFDVVWPHLSSFLSWDAAIFMGVVVAILGIVGDLLESLLKRDADTKDAGSLLPGMGGVMDRIDSPLMGIPGMYYMLLFYIFLKVG